MVQSKTIAKWGRLKRLSFIIDDQVEQGLLSGASLTEPDENGMHFVAPGATTQEVGELHKLVYDLDLVLTDYDWMAHALPERPIVESLDLDETKKLITGIFRGDHFIEGLLIGDLIDGLVQKLCRRAYFLTLTADDWPSHFPIKSEKSIEVGLVCRSIDGNIEGRTEGDRRRCPSKQCRGWLVGVRWQDGQLLRICTEGWHFDPVKKELQVVGGGQISARVVSPKPLGRPPLARGAWPSRSELKKFRAWSQQKSKS